MEKVITEKILKVIHPSKLCKTALPTHVFALYPFNITTLDVSKRC